MSAEVTSLQVDRRSFPVVDCGACGRRSLAFAEPAGRDVEYRCLSCGSLVTSDSLSLVGRRSVESLGYVFSGGERNGRRSTIRGKCGVNGVRGCGSGGCGSGGSCSTGCGGGCSSKR